MTTGKSTFFFFLFILLTLPFAWFVYIVPTSSANNFFRQLPSLINSTIISQFPDDLTITIKQGIVSLNQPTPYCLLLKKGSMYGIVFDPQSKTDPHALDSTGPYSQLCTPVGFVGRDFVMYKNQDQLRINQIPPKFNLSLDRLAISSFVSRSLPKVISYGRTVYYILPFFLIFPLLVFFLLTNLWYSFISRIALKLLRRQNSFNFDEVYGFSLFVYLVIIFFHWVIIGLIINNILNTPFTLNFPFLNTLLISAANIMFLQSKSQIQSPPTEPITGEPILPPLEYKKPRVSDKKYPGT